MLCYKIMKYKQLVWSVYSDPAALIVVAITDLLFCSAAYS